MFIIKDIYVEDKNLAKLLTSMAGLVLNMSAPQPMLNAVVKGKKVQAVSSGGAIKDRVREAVINLGKGASIDSDQIRKLVVTAGGAPTSSIGLGRTLVEEKVLKRRSRGNFVVL